MIVCGASTAYIVGSVVSWRTLALTGEFFFTKKRNRKFSRIYHKFLLTDFCFCVLIYAGLIPCLLLLVGLFFIPESPRWLVSYCHKPHKFSTIWSTKANMNQTLIQNDVSCRRKLAGRKNLNQHCIGFEAGMLI